MKIYDVIIVGGGPAAMSAAIYATREKLKFKIISKDQGGQVIWSSTVENYLGFSSINGMDLSSRFVGHLKKNDVYIDEEEVIEIKKDPLIVKTNKKEYSTKTILIATGKKPRKLKVKGEDKYLRKGVAYCSTCDAPVFSGLDVAVIGGGNSALESALTLEKYANKISLITINDKLGGEKSLIEKVKKSKKTTIYTNTETKEIVGNGSMVNGLKILKKTTPITLKLSGVFIEIGSAPSVEFDKITKKDRWNEIKIKEKDGISNQTSIKGIFAAGDVTNVSEKQVIVAAGEGAKAMLSIIKYLSLN
jgi:alkyl hydroperoxide reductase subunit F